MKKIISITAICFFLFCLVLLYVSNRASKRYTLYYLPQWGMFAKVFPGDDGYTVISFSKDSTSLLSNNVMPSDSIDYVKEKMSVGRDADTHFWHVKKGQVDTILSCTGHRYITHVKSFPSISISLHENMGLDYLYNYESSKYNESYYGFYLIFYQGRHFLMPLGDFEIVDLGVLKTNRQ